MIKLNSYYYYYYFFFFVVVSMAKKPGNFALQKICLDIHLCQKEDMSGNKATYGMVPVVGEDKGWKEPTHYHKN
jgi:hypothetical protein